LESDKVPVRFEKIIINNVNDFIKLKDLWQKLETGNDMTIYQSYDWNLLLYREETVADLNKAFSGVHIVICWEGGTPVCLVPLIINKHSVRIGNHGREKGIYLLGYKSYSDYLNIIYKDITEDVIIKLLSKIQSFYAGYQMLFTDILANTLFGKVLVDQRIGDITESIAVEVVRREDLESYNSLLSKSVKQNLRTARNRMLRDGYKYSFEIFTGTLNEELINDLVGLHLRRMRTKNTDTTSISKKIESSIDIFLRARKEKINNVVRESMKCMKQSFCEVVYLNEKIAGFLYGLHDRKAIRIMQNCVNDNFRFYSPMFRGAYDYIVSTYNDNNVEIVDFTRGNEQYKYNLGGTEKRLISLRIF